MAKTSKRRIGDIGEEVVCKYLVNKGYFVVGRNYWRPWGEIDIVVSKGDLLSFVEVKTVRRNEGQVSRENSAEEGQGIRPEENLHPAKLRRLHRVVQTYLLEKKVPESKNWQIDLACVYLDFKTKKARVEMVENIIV